MFYIKNDDIEDMFKKAADEYELNEEMAADWNTVYASLQDDIEFVPVIKKEKKRRLYLLWLLLLIPAIAIFTYKTVSFSTNKNAQHSPVTTIHKKNNEQNLSVTKDLVTKSNANNSIEKRKSNINAQGNSNKKVVANNKFISAQNQLLPQANNTTVSGSNNSLLPDNSNSSINNLSQINISENNSNDKLSKENLSNLTLNNQQLQPLNNTIKNNTIKNEVVQSNTSNQKRKNNNSNYTRQAFFYTGFIGNADLSFVKFQRASSLGYGLGIIGGYHFKNGLSVETGLLYDKKSYFTKGEYFDKDKLPYLQTVNLLSANGNCHMWEVPVNFKYDFSAHKNHNWFITTGLSSYIMNREYYNFQYEKDGVVSEKGYNFYNASRNWFSVLNVGGGINIKTSDKYFLQVQPYYKVPLGGVGKGSLSLSSAGINLSITRRLH